MQSRYPIPPPASCRSGSRGAATPVAGAILPLALLLAGASLPAAAQTYPGSLGNTATLTLSGISDPEPGNNTAEDVNTLQIQADVGIEKTFLSAAAAPFVVGQVVQYRIDVSNDGPSAARDVVISDTPTNLAIASVAGDCSALPCTIASLAPGASVSMIVDATIVASGPFSNSATATLPGGDVDPDPSDNTDDGGGGNAAAPGVSIAVAPASLAEDSGASFTYTVSFDVAPAVDTVVNLGFGGSATAGSDYSGQVASVTVPAGQTSATVIVMPSTDTEVEQDETVEVTVQAGSGYVVGATATASATIVNDDTSADLSVVKTFTSTGTFYAGQLVTYTIAVSNAGPSVATDVAISDIPTNLEIVGTTGDCTGMPCTIATLASGATATVELTARILAAGAFSNAASVTAPGVPDPDPTNNTDDGGGGNAVQPGASISVAPSSVAEDSGDALVFTITLDVAPTVDTTFTIDWSGTATAGTDYTGSLATVTIPAGSTTGTVTVIPTADTVFEGDETVIATLQPGSVYTVTDGTAQATITEDDLRRADLSISKSDSSATYVPGGSASYTIVVSNAGPDAALGVVVTDNLPRGVTLSGAWTCTAGAGATCSSGSGGSAGGTSVSVTIDFDATGTATITVPVVFSSNPADY